MPLDRQSESRWERIKDEAEMRRSLRAYLASEHGDTGYPHWLSPDAFRRYFCIATGDCSWGPLFERDSDIFGPARFCWKCRSSWGNPLATQDDRPWRRTRWPFTLLERFERWRFGLHLDRIGRRAEKQRANAKESGS